MAYPYDVRTDHKGRERARIKDPRFITERYRNGGCCLDFSRCLECNRCHSVLGLELEWLTDLDVRTVVVLRDLGDL